jgi:fatty acyl-CoA reductase
MNSKEKTIFKLDSNDLNKKEYFIDCLKGARRYILKEKDEDIPLAIKTHESVSNFLNNSGEVN